jgi:hypothetical protein
VRAFALYLLFGKHLSMNICVFTVAYDSGHYRARMGRGPDHLYESGMKPLLTRLGHNFKHEEITVSDSYPAEIKTAFALKAKDIFPFCFQVTATRRSAL